MVLVNYCALTVMSTIRVIVMNPASMAVTWMANANVLMLVPEMSDLPATAQEKRAAMIYAYMAVMNQECAFAMTNVKMGVMQVVNAAIQSVNLDASTKKITVCVNSIV